MGKSTVWLLSFALLGAASASRKSSSKAPEESGGNFQGDMILNKLQVRDLDASPRNGIISKKFHWPKVDGKAIVHFVFDKEKAISGENFDLIRSALRDIENKTCVRFIEGDEENPIKVFNGRGCYAHVGKQSGQQLLSLGENCLRKGTIIHEFLHALGFYHMHSSHDRDKFIKIRMKNVNPKHRPNFEKFSNLRISHFGTTYDFDSVMHYPRNAFSDQGLMTIVTRDPKFRRRIGQRIGLSDGDIKRINNMYDCKSLM